ncbi:unnamed protein product [Kuraishia capsulata CBS 1993]|uniref:Methyltransferase type 11 domain-containing protein n=1 Tax=Kuraishia capsulata CBS 1993 TaxID=1382522 RepID=W6MTN3_9ASCO|nr:uncharacterized protein KUCA_T00004545001 [Kuraishia capsulata CBS 1993]CDK28562.1 unnamed protein product [Kuraishia capsulata CBS 1993]
MACSKSITRGFHTRIPPCSQFQVFDRSIKLKQRARAASDPESSKVEYLRDEIARRSIERLSFIDKKFVNFMDFGSNSGNFVKTLCHDDVRDSEQLKDDKRVVKERLQSLLMVDSCKEMLFRYSDEELLQGSKDFALSRKVVDEELFNDPAIAEENKFEGIISNLSLHWINDLPRILQSIHKSLKPDGMFMGTMFGGDTLFELRTALQLAELERKGGISPRVSPFVGSSDVGNLMQRAKFNLLTVDVEEIVVAYPDMWSMMRDLQLMGESNSILQMPTMLDRDMLLAAEPIYRAMHGDEKDGSLPATFRLVFMIGWKPSPNQPKPLKRGTQDFSLKDAWGDGVLGTSKLIEDK